MRHRIQELTVTVLSDRSPSQIDVIVHELSRTDARRIAVRAQLLDGTRPSDLAETRSITLAMTVVTVAVAPSADADDRGYL